MKGGFNNPPNPMCRVLLTQQKDRFNEGGVQ